MVSRERPFSDQTEKNRYYMLILALWQETLKKKGNSIGGERDIYVRDALTWRLQGADT